MGQEGSEVRKVESRNEQLVNHKGKSLLCLPEQTFSPAQEASRLQQLALLTRKSTGLTELQVNFLSSTGIKWTPVCTQGRTSILKILRWQIPLYVRLPLNVGALRRLTL